MPDVKGMLQNTSSYVGSLRTTDFEKSNCKNNTVAKMQEALDTRLRAFFSYKQQKGIRVMQRELNEHGHVQR